MTRRVFLFEMLLIAAALAATAVLYPHMPARVPTHWNFRFHPDGYSSKLALFWIGPGLMAGVMLLTWILPWLSPKKFEIESFRSTYGLAMLITFGIVAYINVFLLWAAVDSPINAGKAICGGVCVFVALFGNLLGKVRRNFYLGVRTPWTLANERVWYATHRFAAKTFVAAGLLGLLLSVIGLYLWAMFSLLAGGLVPAVYSLVYYKQLERSGELGEEITREPGR
jgi:uncharacterized membrane protein